MRKYWIIIVAVLSVCSAWGAYSLHQSHDEYVYPDANLIIISLDTLRADRLGCYGYSRNTSPAIDDLSNKSIVFDNVWSQSPLTAPSHMTMFTSLYPSVHGVFQPDKGILYTLPSPIITLAQILQSSGYTTVGFTGGGSVASDFGFNKGFDIYKENDLLSWLWYITDGMNENDFLDSEMCTWLRNNSQKKFFLFFHTFALHAPYVSPDYTVFTDTAYEGDVPFTYDGSHVKQDITDFSSNFLTRVDINNKQDVRYISDLYDGCIRYTDRQLGTFFKLLEELHLFDNTVVIILSDHGEEFGEHGGLGHGQLYNEHLKVPLIIKMPHNKHKRIYQDVRLLDLMPTVLDLLHIAYNLGTYHFQGTSLMPAMNSVETNSAIIGEHNCGYDKFIKMGDWKFIKYPGKEIVGDVKSDGLYNLTLDPLEQVNLKQANPHVVGWMEEQLDSFIKKNEEMKISLGVESTTTQGDQETIAKLQSLGYLN